MEPIMHVTIREVSPFSRKTTKAMATSTLGVPRISFSIFNFALWKRLIIYFKDCNQSLSLKIVMLFLKISLHHLCCSCLYGLCLVG